MDQFYGSNDLMAIPSAMWQFDKWPNMTVYATYFATATLGGESYRYKAVFGHKIINVLTYSGTTMATAATTNTPITITTTIHCKKWKMDTYPAAFLAIF